MAWWVPACGIVLCCSKCGLPPSNSTSLGSLLYIQNLRLQPNRPNQNQYFNKISRWFMYTLKFEKHWFSENHQLGWEFIFSTWLSLSANQRIAWFRFCSTFISSSFCVRLCARCWKNKDLFNRDPLGAYYMPGIGGEYISMKEIE